MAANIVALVVFVLLLKDIVNGPWEQKFKIHGAFSIVVSVHDIIVCTLTKFGVDLPKFLFDKIAYEKISSNNYVLIMICYVICLTCGLVFYRYNKIKKTRMMTAGCAAHALSACVVFLFSQSLGALNLVFSSIAYAVGLYKCTKKS